MCHVPLLQQKCDNFLLISSAVLEAHCSFIRIPERRSTIAETRGGYDVMRRTASFLFPPLAWQQSGGGRVVGRTAPASSVNIYAVIVFLNWL